ncbi:RNA-binding motif protein 25-like isoform X2 [Actinidia eriantha]|uniref:RNA-binding motif protein 25-like isoform X2 n=1 Tax=Actinidia eriantha TaxID=165200 RepID=UPI0025830408|nr:RNA-binding motif protein 25-like isoform X2 [Actinidia eriantha]XP_057486281.1 RNA-binding motif protein 25-like isoform X2 [Actinidia eriantha]XP_057486282.1 RNA-binding motif protein 25-like isoform X2 [Actinidia eriantha]
MNSMLLSSSSFRFSVQVVIVPMLCCHLCYACMPRYPSPFMPMGRPTFPPRPPGAIGIIPPLSRPPVPGIRGPIIPLVIRPAIVPSITPTEKPQTTVYVGKIASTVESDFILSLLQLCGSVKNWKRAQDPTNGTPKGFGFCEFESAEGVLRALRLLSKLNVDGQELVINVTQATKEYLERYVEKKTENSKKLKETETEGAEKEEEGAPSAKNSELSKPSVEDSKKDDKASSNEENNDSASFGIVTDEDGEADREALEKLTSMIEERLKNNPLPPPPPPPAVDGSGNSNSEQPARSKDGDSDVEITTNDAGEDKNDDEMTSDSKRISEHDRPETSSPDRSRRHDRRGRDKDRDQKREKERELERYEREREQERARREREREYKIKEDERRYKARVKEWESREREKEYLRKLEKEKEKEREYKRKREIMDQEDENNDADTKRRKHKSSGSEDRRRRLREKEEDLVDRLKEEEEAVEAKRRADEELWQHKEEEKYAPEILPGHITNGSDKAELSDETIVGSNGKAVEETYDGDMGDRIIQNGNGDESVTGSIAASDHRQDSNVPSKKLGFGLVGSGKRTAVPSVFKEEEDEDARKEKKMRPLVPIDYSTEELQAVQSTISDAPSPNLAAAAEFAKRISGVTPKEEKHDTERERSRRSHDRSSLRDRDRNDDETNRGRDEGRKENSTRNRDREQGLDKVKTPDNQKLLDAKQLIDLIPKTKDELFSYEINWAIYDKNELHDRMRPWISKKITEFLGEEETTLVDYIVSSTREHVKASEMLERLTSILDDEAEMFVLKMWRMLIFEIKKIETGLAVRSKT